MRERISTILSFLLIASIIVAGFIFHASQDPTKTIDSLQDGQTVLVDIGSKVVKVQVSSTQASSERGLSNTASLATDTGMLFAFPRIGNYGFWMKDMNYPLDIIWLDSGYQIVHIEHDLTPDTYPKEFGSEVLSQYVVELPAGFAAENAVSLGDHISIGQ